MAYPLCAGGPQIGNAVRYVIIIFPFKRRYDYPPECSHLNYPKKEPTFAGMTIHYISIPGSQRPMERICADQLTVISRRWCICFWLRIRNHVFRHRITATVRRPTWVPRGCLVSQNRIPWPEGELLVFLFSSLCRMSLDIRGCGLMDLYVCIAPSQNIQTQVGFSYTSAQYIILKLSWHAEWLIMNSFCQADFWKLAIRHNSCTNSTDIIIPKSARLPRLS